MEENASRAVFLGVSVLVAIITITLIVNFYRAAKDVASVANTFDITTSGNTHLNDILHKGKINGVELRYLLNYYQNDETVKIDIGGQTLYLVNDISNEKTEITINPDVGINNHIVLKENYGSFIEYNIRPNYNYTVVINENKITVTFEN